jgi:hypothetical protein
MVIEMKELEPFFIGKADMKGFVFKLLYKSNKAYIYEVTLDKDVHYEVFKRKINTRYNNVSYPSSQMFGIWAWCYTQKEKAEEKFLSLSKINSLPL